MKELVVDAKGAAQEAIEKARKDLVDLSHRIHAHPELGFEEERASAWLAEALGGGAEDAFGRERERHQPRVIAGGGHQMEPDRKTEAVASHRQRDRAKPKQVRDRGIAQHPHVVLAVGFRVANLVDGGR